MGESLVCGTVRVEELVRSRCSPTTSPPRSRFGMDSELTILRRKSADTESATRVACGWQTVMELAGRSLTHRSCAGLDLRIQDPEVEPAVTHSVLDLQEQAIPASA